MIECPKCHLEYRGSIPKFCMECGMKLPEVSGGKQELKRIHGRTFWEEIEGLENPSLRRKKEAEQG